MLIRFATYPAKTSLTARLITSVITVAGIVGLAGCDNAQSRTPVNSESQKHEASSSSATVTKNESQLQQMLAANLAESGITAKITSVTATSMPNIYWVKAEGLPAFFTDATGQYVVQGDIIKVGGAKPE
ncbi:disulfide isomerase DsbC N-terminal domain-containing protein, partial [Acinetobacter baumannii]|uniref:disulfide isomerase DsbC N-terminal domain-containing protein n=1 Tax=Acinetobacter baumannii TaxID=470 RepID=UPI002AFF2BEF